MEDCDPQRHPRNHRRMRRRLCLRNVHVDVGEKWVGLTGQASDQEEDMLDFAYKVQPNSRLSCQIKVTPELDGLIVTTPDRQG